MIEEMNLRVAEAYHKDVGRGIARICLLYTSPSPRDS